MSKQSQHVTLGRAAEEYLRLRSARFAPTAVANDASQIRRFVAHVGDIQVRHLRPEHVEAYFYGERGLMQVHFDRNGTRREPLAPKSHNFVRQRLNQFFIYLAQRGLTRASLLANVTPMRVERVQRLQPGTDTMWAMLDSEPCARNRAFLATACNTALRAQSLTALRVGDVDLRTLTLRVTVQKSALTDDMPITADLAEELQRWLLTYRTDMAGSEERYRHEVTDNDFLFPGRVGPRWHWRTDTDGTRTKHLAPPRWSPQQQITKPALLVKDALHRVGITDTHAEGIHTLRRGVARAMFDALVEERGYDGALRVTSALLHHSNVSTTETYLGLSTERRTRDEFLRGRSLLGPRPLPSANVTPLRRTT